METVEQNLPRLQDAIYREKVERAQRMTASERMTAGIELFEEAMGRMKIGIRMRHPEASEAETDQLLIEEMERLKGWHERDLYEPKSG